MKSTKTRSIGASSATSGGIEPMKSGMGLNGSGAWRISSPTPGHDYDRFKLERR